MAVIDDIRIFQDWTEDGYVCKILSEELQVIPVYPSFEIPPPTKEQNDLLNSLMMGRPATVPQLDSEKQLPARIRSTDAGVNVVAQDLCEYVDISHFLKVTPKDKNPSEKYVPGLVDVLMRQAKYQKRLTRGQFGRIQRFLDRQGN